MSRKLTNAQVKRIRVAASDGGNYAKLADRYDLTPSGIAAIARGVTYKDAGGPLTTRRMPRGKKGKRGRRRAYISGAKKQATARSKNGRPRRFDLAALSVDDAARFLQALAMEWPKIKESFELLDRIIEESNG